MPRIQPGGDVHARFAILAGLIRHEYRLHQQRSEDFGFEADPDTLTISATRQREGAEPCITTYTEEVLMRDLHVLATDFYKHACTGESAFSRSTRRR